MTRILIVDDDPLFAAMLRQDLLGEGYRSLVTTSAVKALRALDHGLLIDVIVTDILMPEMDGIELIQALCQRHAGLPIIALSSGGEHSFRGILPIARVLGADRALYKPVSATVIGAIIRDLLHGPRDSLKIDGTIADSDTHGHAA
jgi:CheY-like chemotaxis protein